MIWPPSITLSGERVTIEPLSLEHHDALVDVVRDGELWKLWYTKIPSPEGIQADIERRLGLRERGSMLPFVIVDKAKGRVVGATSYMNVDAENRRVEIGSTWYAQSAQRTGVNTECKFLLLRHAFERLGAKLDGILRSHWRLPNGALRDTCVYSIIAAEWPTVKAHLQWQMAKPRT